MRFIKNRNSLSKNLAWLLFFGALCFLIAFFGSIATYHSVNTWYPALKKPSWNPPAWIFGPVWTLLYCMIAYAGWLIFVSEKSKKRSKALLFYFIQLLLNGLWSFLFFYFQSPWLGLMDILLLTFFIAVTLCTAWSVSKGAVIFLLPYLLWTLYAVTLDAAIALMN